MATTITFNGSSFSVPAYGDTGWAQGSGNLSSYLIAIPSGCLQTTGGTFTLSADVNFGSSYGCIAKYFKTSGGATLPAYYSSTFTNQTSVTITHNLGHYPIVQILDGSNNLIIPDTLSHGSVNAFTVTFNPALTGTIIYVG